MTEPRTPRTEAGRALLDGLPVAVTDEWVNAILAIEAEASLGSSERLAAALEAAGVWDPELESAAEHAACILAADPALSDPDAERQRAVGEAVERLPVTRLPVPPEHQPMTERGRTLVRLIGDMRERAGWPRAENVYGLDIRRIEEEAIAAAPACGTGARAMKAQHATGGNDVPPPRLNLTPTNDVNLSVNLALVGLTQHIDDLHRALGDLKDGPCPFVRAVTYQKSGYRAVHEVEVYESLRQAGRLVPEGRRYCEPCERSVKAAHYDSHVGTDIHRYNVGRRRTPGME
jgi:hypothetical protein